MLTEEKERKWDREIKKERERERMALVSASRVNARRGSRETDGIVACCNYRAKTKRDKKEEDRERENTRLPSLERFQVELSSLFLYLLVTSGQERGRERKEER